MKDLCVCAESALLAPRFARFAASVCACLQWYTIVIVTVMIYKRTISKYADLLLFCVYLCNARIAAAPKNVAG
jgi:hypothetical protein